MGFLLLWDPNPANQGITNYYVYWTSPSNNGGQNTGTNTYFNVVETNFARGVVRFEVRAQDHERFSAPAVLLWTNTSARLRIGLTSNTINFDSLQDPMNTNDVFDLQFSPDGGLTWMDAFEFRFINTNLVPKSISIESNPEYTNGTWRIKEKQ